MSFKKCPKCGVTLRKNKKVCPKCGYDFKKIDHNTMKQCPNCGNKLYKTDFYCKFCGYRFTKKAAREFNPQLKQCPNCGVTLKKNKKVCPKCGYDFKKTKHQTTRKQCPNCGHKLNESAINCGFCGYSFSNETNKNRKNNQVPQKSDYNSRINEPINIKHFDNGIISFDYPDNYFEDFNSNYEKIGILTSFKIGFTHDIDSAFAIFEGEPISNKIPATKFKEVIKKSLGLDVLDINRYSFGEKERIIIKTQNKIKSNIEYYCNVPEIGFSILFIIPKGKEYLFDEKYVSTVINSLEKSTNETIYEEKVKTCPKCGAENSDEFIFCLNCGMKLEEETVDFCSHCGTEIIPGAKFCLNCGRLIE